MHRIDGSLGLQFLRVGVHVAGDEVTDRLQHGVGQRAAHHQVAVVLELLGRGRGSFLHRFSLLSVGYLAVGTGPPLRRRARWYWA